MGDLNINIPAMPELSGRWIESGSLNGMPMWKLGEYTLAWEDLGSFAWGFKGRGVLPHAPQLGPMYPTPSGKLPGLLFYFNYGKVTNPAQLKGGWNVSNGKAPPDIFITDAGSAPQAAAVVPLAAPQPVTAAIAELQPTPIFAAVGDDKKTVISHDPPPAPGTPVLLGPPVPVNDPPQSCRPGEFLIDGACVQLASTQPVPIATPVIQTTTAPPETPGPTATDTTGFALPEEILGFPTTYVLIAAGIGAFLLFGGRGGR